MGKLGSVSLGAMSFQHPWVFAGLFVWLLLLVMRLRAERKNRRSLQIFATERARSGLLTRVEKNTIGREFVWHLAWLVALVGAAGPQWGLQADVPLVTGRDLVLVLDMSNSMRATDAPPSRFDVARDSAIDLVEYLRSRPGYRLGVVVFAASADLLCPLTEDLSVVRVKLEALSLDTPPPRIRPKGTFVSGTSFEAAVVTASAAHDPRMAGFQDVILLSDGDDPAGPDSIREALAGAEAAGIPIHSVGIGDPKAGAQIQVAGRDQPVLTRLVEFPLQELARRTQGVYVGAAIKNPDLVRFFRQQIEPKERTITPGHVPPQRVSRASLCYGTAALLWAVCLLGQRCIRQFVADRIRTIQRLGVEWSRSVVRYLARRWPIVAVGLTLLTAAEPKAPLDWERLGDDALSKQRYGDAAMAYRQALELSEEPPRLAYKLGVADFFRGHYRDAERWFRAAAMTSIGEEKAKALYNWGTCLLHRSEGVSSDLLDQAIPCFESCLALKPNEALQRDARQNLELAKLLRMQIPRDQPNSPDTRRGPLSSREAKSNRLDAVASMKTGTPANGMRVATPTSSRPEAGAADSSSPDQDPLPGATSQVLLTHRELVQPLTPAEAREEVRRAVERIARQRRNMTRARLSEMAPYPDW